MTRGTQSKNETSSSERSVYLLQEIASKLVEHSGDVLYPSASILTEADVQNHQILVIYDTSCNQVKLSFALKPDAWTDVLENPSQDEVQYGSIFFGNTSSDEESFLFSESIYRQVGTTHLQVAKATKGDLVISAAVGYVQLAIPVKEDGLSTSLALAADDINEAMELLGLSMWASPATENTAHAWMLETYTAQNSINVGRDKMAIEEVYPGYYVPTVVGRAQELKAEFGRFALYHYFAERMLLPLAKTGVIYSKLGRMQRGLVQTSAQSVQTDFETGGALGAFTTCVAEKRLKEKEERDYDLTVRSIVAIIDPNEMDRTDYRALPYDWYGSSNEPGLTPRDFLQFVSTDPDASRNEVVFNTGVKIKAFAVPQGRREELVALLKSEGVNEMNGKPIEECVIEAHTQLDWLNIAWQEQIQSIAVD